MGRSSRGRAVAAAVALGLVLPAGAHGDEPAPLRTEHTWFTCGEGQLGASGNATRSSWGLERPAVRVADGGGCLTADPSAVELRSPHARASFEAVGSFRGRLETLTVALDAADGLLGLVPQDLEISLSADGGPAREVRVDAQPAPSADGRLRYQVTLTGLGLDEDREHALHLTVDVGRNGVPGVVWVVGASDADGGLVLNPTAPAGDVVALPG